MHKLALRPLSGALLVAAALVLAGCHHEVRLDPMTSSTVGLTRSQARVVGVVLDGAAVPDSVDTGTDGHSFTLQNVRQFYEQAFRTALRDQVGKVELLFARPKAGKKLDAVVYLQVAVEMSGYLNHTCTARANVRVEDPTGRVVAQHEGVGKHDFVPMALGGDACLRAMAGSFTQASAALRAIDDL